MRSLYSFRVGGASCQTNTPRSGRGSALSNDEAMAVPKHRIYRLGDHLAARLPRIGRATEQASKEAKWLLKLAPHLPLAVPVQLAMGHPAEGYPFEWSATSG